MGEYLLHRELSSLNQDQDMKLNKRSKKDQK